MAGATTAQGKTEIAGMKAELRADIADLRRHVWLMGLCVGTAVVAIVKRLQEPWLYGIVNCSSRSRL